MAAKFRNGSDASLANHRLEGMVRNLTLGQMLLP